MAGIVDGQRVDAANSNSAWIARNGDSDTIGKLDLKNDDAASGAHVTNLQKQVNGLNSFTGATPNGAYNQKPSWTNNQVGSSSDNLKDRADALTATFDTTTGHSHDGSDSRKIEYSSLLGTQLESFDVEGTTLSGVTGSSKDVSSEMAGESPSNSPTIPGVVVNSPYNLCELRDLADDEFLDGYGNRVYGRITYASGVWTLSFYSNIGGTETPYSFASSTDIKWYFQKLFSELTRPVYTKVVVSSQVAGEIPDGTTTIKGKVQFATNGEQTALKAIQSNDSTLVRTTGDQDIGGVKRFTGNTIKVGDGANTVNKLIEFDNGSTNKPGLRYDKTSGRCQFSHDGTTWANMGSGGGGGTMLSLHVPTDSPVPMEGSIYDTEMYMFSQVGEDSEVLAFEFRVPSGYEGGQISLVVVCYTANPKSSPVSDYFQISSISYRIVPGTDALDSTTNSRTSSNAETAVSANAKATYSISLDLTDSEGKINGQQVAAGHIIKGKVYRTTPMHLDTTQDIGLLKNATNLVIGG